MMKLLFDLLKVLAIIYAIIAILLYFFQDKFIFFPQKITFGNRAEFSRYEISVENNGVMLHGWFIKREISRNSPLIIYYGGNAEDVSGNLQDLERFHTGSFLFVNYRGYGNSDGKPTQDLLFEDALFIHDYIVKTENINADSIILMGRSLGSGVAVYVAKHREVGGVVLVTPFDSVTNLAKRHFPIFPVGILLKHRFESTALASDIMTPAISIMGSNDGIVPNKHSMDLVNSWGGPIKAVIINGATHNDVQGYELYWQAINEFLKSLNKHRL